MKDRIEVVGIFLALASLIVALLNWLSPFNPVGNSPIMQSGIYITEQPVPQIYTETPNISVPTALSTSIPTLEVVRQNPTFFPTDLVAYYPFNGNANDVSGNENHGKVYGATLAEDRFMRPNSAYYFNGENNYIKIPSSPSIAELKKAMSIAVWIRVDIDTNYNVYDYRHVLSKGATYEVLWADYAVGLSNPKGDLLWEYSNTSNAHSMFNTKSSVSQGEWHHIAITFDNSTILIYLDGILQKAGTGLYSVIRDSSQPLYIGCRYEKPLYGVFKGSIDDVKIYNRALSQQEIQALYESE